MTVTAKYACAGKTAIVAQYCQTGHDFASDGVVLVVPAGSVRLQ